MDQQNIFEKICSYETLCDAWERTCENAGCRGSDGVSISAFYRNAEKNICELSNDLYEQRYTPFPLLRFPVPKSKSDGVRYLSVPTVRGRIAQAAVYLASKEIFEAEFEDLSHAYRKGRGVPTAIAQIKKWRDKGFRLAVDADIDSYFDSVPHDILLTKVTKLFSDKRIVNLFRAWTIAEVYDGQKIWTLEKGIPQGSVVSPILANLFLDELDETLMSFGKKLVRYADDFLILSKTEQEALESIDITDMILEDLHLDLNLKKTRIVTFDRGFKFLGAIFLYDDVYIPYPEKKKKQKSAIKLPPPLTLKKYIELLNNKSQAPVVT